MHFMPKSRLYSLPSSFSLTQASALHFLRSVDALSVTTNEIRVWPYYKRLFDGEWWQGENEISVRSLERITEAELYSKLKLHTCQISPRSSPLRTLRSVLIFNEPGLSVWVQRESVLPTATYSEAEWYSNFLVDSSIPILLLWSILT